MPQRMTEMFSGEETYCCHHGGSQVNKGEVEETISKIHDLYNAGVPFFTREALQDVVEQLSNAVEEVQKVSVEGLDGNKVEFEIQSGLRFPTTSPDLEMVVGEPCIYYRSFQNMISPHEYHRRNAYCTLRIMHRMTQRNKMTNEISHIPLQSDEDAAAFWHSVRGKWEDSEPCRLIRSILRRISISSEVNKIIGFALGPMSDAPPDRETYRSVFQHVLISTIREALTVGRTSSNSITCYVQDPAYTEVDESLLRDQGINVLPDPKGFLEVDNSTAVISSCADVSVKQIVSDLAEPPLVIWNRILDHESSVPSTDPDSPRIRKMFHDRYDAFEFPGDKEYFGDLVIYIKRSAAQT